MLESKSKLLHNTDTNKGKTMKTALKTYISNFAHAGKNCDCGCKGKDPWHKSSFRRVIRDDDGEEGWALFPWGASRVTRNTDPTVKTRWYLVDDADRARVINGEKSAQRRPRLDHI